MDPAEFMGRAPEHMVVCVGRVAPERMAESMVRAAQEARDQSIPAFMAAQDLVKVPVRSEARVRAMAPKVQVVQAAMQA